MSRITRMTHPVHFTSERKRENMWNFYDPKRNTVFWKSDDKMSWAEDVKNKTQNVACNLVLAGTYEKNGLSFSCCSPVFALFPPHLYAAGGAFSQKADACSFHVSPDASHVLACIACSLQPSWRSSGSRCLGRKPPAVRPPCSRHVQPQRACNPSTVASK